MEGGAGHVLDERYARRKRRANLVARQSASEPSLDLASPSSALNASSVMLTSSQQDASGGGGGAGDGSASAAGRECFHQPPGKLDLVTFISTSTLHTNILIRNVAENPSSLMYTEDYRL